MTDYCKECDKPARAKCYGCVMTFEHHDLDVHDVRHDTPGNRDYTPPPRNIYTGEYDD